MKRIYLLMLVTIFPAVSALAQRNVDMSLRRFYKLGTATPTMSDEIVNGTHILFDADKNYKVNFGYIIKNGATLAKDSVSATDTIKIRATLGGGILHNVASNGISLAAGGQTGIVGLTSYPKALTPGPGFNNTSGAIPVKYCDSIWIISPVGSGNPAVEANPVNDTVCSNVIVDGWMTGINDVDVDAEGNGLLVYPNPAVSRDINIMYNFGANTSKAVVTIVDVTGKVVYNKIIGTDLKGTQNIALQMGNITPGMYSVRLATDDKTTVEKIFVK
jgi:hypothetical protein